MPVGVAALTGTPWVLPELPSPTWPFAFCPQPQTSPVDRSARPWLSPAATAVAFAIVPARTRLGTTTFGVPPSPSWPMSSCPTPQTSPGDWRIRLKLFPPAIPSVPVMLFSSTGAVSACPVPLPSSPRVLLPQVHTVPSDSIAMQLVPDTDTETTFVSTPTWPGVGTVVYPGVPDPS